MARLMHWTSNNNNGQGELSLTPCQDCNVKTAAPAETVAWPSSSDAPQTTTRHMSGSRLILSQGELGNITQNAVGGMRMCQTCQDGNSMQSRHSAALPKQRHHTGYFSTLGGDVEAEG